MPSVWSDFQYSVALRSLYLGELSSKPDGAISFPRLV